MRAVLLVGVTGYGVAMLFLLHGAPDLALTQVLVETVSIAVFVLVLRRLPVKFRDFSTRLDRRLRWALGIAVGSVMFLLALTAGCLLVVTGWGIHRVVGRALAPVERIRLDVERIRSSHRPERVTVPATGDEIERLAITMNAMLDRLDAADASQRAFISDASHELRSPLATIRILTETDAEPSESTRVIHAETLRLQGIVESLLALGTKERLAPAALQLTADLGEDEVVVVDRGEPEFSRVVEQR